MADIVHLQQRLPLRWPVGNDATHMIPLRAVTMDEEWLQLRQSGVLGNWRRPMWRPEELPPGGIPQEPWLPGAVVLITGASRGFGEAAAREIAARGGTVIATMRNPGRDAAAVVAGFEDRIVPVQLDVTDSVAVDEVVAEAIARFGRIDAVINNAGYGLYGPVEDLSEDEVRRQLDTNFVGQWRLVKAVLPHMRERRRGKIINVSSLSGQMPSPLMAFYAASKHAVEAMSEALAGELAPWNVQVCIMQPGMYRSDWQTTNLDVCAAFREGRSAYRRGIERQLNEFRARAITRPGSDAVAAAMADAVELQQPLPLRWPIGDDVVRLLPRRRLLSDDDWEQQLRGFGWGFRPEEME
jgi:NAD(P)-dependent dehydrogenase (short-subunit alcohol dehydrogenase family)